MCKLCDRGSLQNHYFASRRDFLKGTAAIGATTAGLSLFAARPAAADDDDAPEPRSPTRVWWPPCATGRGPPNQVSDAWDAVMGAIHLLSRQSRRAA